MKNYDIIVIGGGHAGCEAALATAKMGCSVLLITPQLDKIATMPCNPAIGGPGKGHLVLEIDALGGVMGKITDSSLIQIRLLNHSKGPAVQAYRAQIEREDYKKLMFAMLKKQENLDLLEEEVVKVQSLKFKVQSVITKSGKEIKCKAVIVATGTFLNAQIIIGDKVIKQGGRIDADASLALSKSLENLGLKLNRLQTATPPRIAKNTVNLSKMEEQPGTSGLHSFSFPKREVIKPKDQISCWFTYTNSKTHQIIRDNINFSPIKSGIIEEHGPRHCPSIDRKVINFPKRSRHPVFVEPEGRNSDRMYLQGLTTAMPEPIQEKIIRSVPGLEKAKILQPGYAVVYDFVPPYQIKNTLETKKISGLYMSGQICGTSGYEEAAAQGLIAGINSALKIKGKKPFILRRDQAYIGVLIDDLVTKEHQEPYRIYTSRAEYRLFLRQDNADLRLSEPGFKLGLVSFKDFQKVEQKRKQITESLREIRKNNSWLKFLRQPQNNINSLLNLTDKKLDFLKKLPIDVLEQIEIEIKYDGYLKKQKVQAQKAKKLETKKLPPDLNYKEIPGLRNSARERLLEVNPLSIGQASRISGVTPADISILLIWLEKLKFETQKE